MGTRPVDHSSDDGARDLERRAIDGERIADLFGRVRELGPSEQHELLADECAGQPELRAEVDSLLKAATSTDRFLEGGVDGERAAALIRDDDASAAPRRVGPYRLRHELGRGGMGAVFLAERADDEYHQEVAVKLLRAGWVSEPMLQRFRTERQLLARLEHPNIARLLDGGTTEDGAPYVVMERVAGLPIDEFCEQRDLGLDGRIELFLGVCAAVAYAHQNLIVHRDLKPSNVLVSDDGTPKLLDFGIAKLLDSDDPHHSVAVTHEMQRLMTPDYASPEQVLGVPVTTATDVYSLGALLYRLLAGVPPFQLSGKPFGEIEHIVRELAPPAAGTGAEDLDNIIGKALRKEPAQRYESVGELSEDLRRYLVGRPVSARPATLRYRATRFLQRHRGAAFSLLTGVALLVATAGAYTLRLTAERDLARAEADKAQQVKELLVSLFRSSSPRASNGADLSAREVLDAGARRLALELREQPEIHAELLDTIARVYLELDVLEEAGPLAERSLATRQALFGDASAEAAESRETLAQVRIGQAHYDAARDLLDRALATRSALSGPASAAYADTLYSKAMLELRQSNDSRAREILQDVLVLRERLQGAESPEVAKVLDSLAILARRLDEPDRAEELYRRIIAIYEKAYGPEHPVLGNTLNNFGVLLSRTDRLEEARATYERALAIHQRTYGPDHDLVAGTLDNLGETLKNLGRPEEAVPLVERALAYRERHLGPLHQATGTTLNTLGNIYRVMGRFDEAVPLFERAIAAYSASLGEEHFWLGWPLSNLGKLYLLQGDPGRARALLQRALDLRRNTLGEQHSLVAASLEDLARLEQGEGRLAVAIELYRPALEIRRALPGGRQAELVSTLRLLAEVLSASGAEVEAEQLEREVQTLTASDPAVPALSPSDP